MPEFHVEMAIAKTDLANRMVFGFFSVVEENGKAVVDKHDDIIEVGELEMAAYDFVLNARVAGEQHDRMQVGNLIESVVFTTEKQAAIVAALKQRGIDASMNLKSVGWWGGFHITDDEVAKALENGDYVMFSIGGTATREEISDS